MGHQEGDAVSSMPKRSAQEELAKYQLLKEKLAVRDGKGDGLSDGSRAVLSAMSEVEVLTMKIAAKLSTDEKYSQHTAAYEQLANLSGETSYIGIAEYLANEIYELNRGKFILDQFNAGGDIASLTRERLQVPGVAGYIQGLGRAAAELARAAVGGAGSSSSA